MSGYLNAFWLIVVRKSYKTINIKYHGKLLSYTNRLGHTVVKQLCCTPQRLANCCTAY